MENLCREEENLIKDIKKAFQNKKKTKFHCKI